MVYCPLQIPEVAEHKTDMAKAERNYEMVLILSPDVSEDELPDVLERANRAIVDRGGSIQDQDMWGRRRLAYPIQRHREGTYVISHINLQPHRVAEVDASLRLQEQVIRHLLVRLDE